MTLKPVGKQNEPKSHKWIRSLVVLTFGSSAANNTYSSKYANQYIIPQKIKTQKKIGTVNK